MQPNVPLVLHGLLGQGRNWRTFSRNLAQKAEKATGQPWQVLTLDLRCHGDSAAVAGFHPPHDMQSSAQDVVGMKLMFDAHLLTTIHAVRGRVDITSCTSTSVSCAAN
jgi:pimeloyl-ACP methyl ester carboxylesterase